MTSLHWERKALGRGTIKMSTLAADRNFWDPLLDVFDFSLKFEEVILEIIPSIIGIILFLVFANRYRLEPVYIRTSPLLWIKLVSHSQPILSK